MNWMTKVVGLAVTLAGAVAMAGSAVTATVEIPFVFQAHQSALPGGSYRVSLENREGGKVLMMRNGKQSVLLAVTQTAAAGKDRGQMALTFVCAQASCALAGAQVGPGTYITPVRKWTAREREQAYTVTIPAKGRGE